MNNWNKELKKNLIVRLVYSLTIFLISNVYLYIAISDKKVEFRSYEIILIQAISLFTFILISLVEFIFTNHIRRKEPNRFSKWLFKQKLLHFGRNAISKDLNKKNAHLISNMSFFAGCLFLYLLFFGIILNIFMYIHISESNLLLMSLIVQMICVPILLLLLLTSSNANSYFVINNESFNHVLLDQEKMEIPFYWNNSKNYKNRILKSFIYLFSCWFMLWSIILFIFTTIAIINNPFGVYYPGIHNNAFIYFYGPLWSNALVSYFISALLWFWLCCNGFFISYPIEIILLNKRKWLITSILSLNLFLIVVINLYANFVKKYYGSLEINNRNS